jgi:hypothetical protein
MKVKQPQIWPQFCQGILGAFILRNLVKFLKKEIIAILAFCKLKKDIVFNIRLIITSKNSKKSRFIRNFSHLKAIFYQEWQIFRKLSQNLLLKSKKDPKVMK